MPPPRVEKYWLQAPPSGRTTPLVQAPVESVPALLFLGVARSILMSNFHSGTRPLHGDNPTSWTWFGSSMKASLTSQCTHAVFAKKQRIGEVVQSARCDESQTSSSQGHGVPKTQPVPRTSQGLEPSLRQIGTARSPRMCKQSGMYKIAQV